MIRPDELLRLATLPTASILVFSDSHHQSDFLLKTAASHAQSDLAIHLGDHCGLLDELSLLCPVPLTGVAGNCDGWAGRHLPEHLVFTVAGRRIFITHGHRYGVKHQLGQLLAAGSMPPNSADIILFGHTHQMHESRVEVQGRDLLLLNPGSCRPGAFGQPASALLLHLQPDRIVTEFLLDLP